MFRQPDVDKLNKYLDQAWHLAYKMKMTQVDNADEDDDIEMVLKGIEKAKARAQDFNW